MQLPVSMATLKEQTFQESWKLGDGRGRNVDGTNDLEPHILSTSRCQHRSGHGLLLLPSCSVSDAGDSPPVAAERMFDCWQPTEQLM